LVTTSRFSETQDADSCPCQEIVPGAVTLLRGLVIVRGTVEFDRHAFARAEEIQRVRSHAMLTTEFPARELTTLKMLAQPRFPQVSIARGVFPDAWSCLEGYGDA
jgi:hypothetical protein